MKDRIKAPNHVELLIEDRLFTGEDYQTEITFKDDEPPVTFFFSERRKFALVWWAQQLDRIFPNFGPETEEPEDSPARNGSEAVAQVKLAIDNFVHNQHPGSRYALLRSGKGQYSIIRVHPSKNLVWDIVIPDAGNGKFPYELVELLNKQAAEQEQTTGEN